MLEIRYSAQFKRDYKLLKKRGAPLKKLKATIELLASGKTLPPKYRDHQLSGKYDRIRECHIGPDWLLLYEIDRGCLTLIAHRTGSHSDIF